MVLFVRCAQLQGCATRGFRALRDHLGFVLRDGRQYVNREAVGLREIDGVKLHPRFHQVRYERHVSGEPIKLTRPGCLQEIGKHPESIPGHHRTDLRGRFL
jgi:hypothetical protein